jgi:competence protein ComEA
MKRWLLVIVLWLAFAASALAAVDINSASEAELQALNGIGPVKARAIVEYRKKNGPFGNVDDLQNVKGIGPATLGKIRADVTVGGAAVRPGKR